MSSRNLVLSCLCTGALALAAGCSGAETKAAPKGATQHAAAPAQAPAVVSDRTLEEHVQKAIQADSSLSPQAKAVSVSVRDGTVTLRGQVADEVEKSNLAALTANVAGVVRVENELEIGTG